MKRFLILFLLVVVSFPFMQLKAGSLFFFPSYKSATIYFKDNRSCTEKINYELLEEKLYFIDRTDNQEKIVSAVETIKLLDVDGRKFVIDEDGLKEIILSTPLVYVKYIARFQTKPSKVAYGGSSQVASVNTYTDFRSGGQQSILKQNDYELTGFDYIYWVEKKGKMKKIKNLDHFLKLYPTQNRVLNNYIKKENVNFNAPVSFVNLVSYAAGL